MNTDSDVPQRILIAGCGYVGTRLGELLARANHEVYGLRRDPSGLPSVIRPIAADVTEADSLSDLPPSVDALVYAVSPSGPGEAEYRAAYVEGLRNVLGAVAWSDRAPARLVLVSSTGVYGQRDGRWVDENTPPNPADTTGRVIMEGEALARHWGRGEGRERGGVGNRAAVVVRLGGIYGPGRTRTIRRVVDGHAGCPGPDQYGNRIHRDDAAAVVRHLLRVPKPDAVYIGADEDPAPLRDVYRWIAVRAGAPDPCRDHTYGTGTGGDRRGTNKRCSSRRLVDSGFEFRYPSYKQGYASLIASAV